MNQQQFVRWLLKQQLAPHIVTMAAILFGVEGYEPAREFVEGVRE